MEKKSERHIDRLVQILSERSSPLLAEIKKIKDLKTLTKEMKRKLIEELGDEFSIRGLQANGEPNSYGLEIEGLTDMVGLEQ